VRATATAAALVAAAAALAGCAAYPTSAAGDVRAQVERSVKAAYLGTTTRPAVVTSVTVTVRSGADTIATGNGAADLWFTGTRGRTTLSVDNATGRASVTAVRLGPSFYEADTPAHLAAGRHDLVTQSAADPRDLPQIQAAGLDPFQLTTLLSAVQWPDAVADAQPRVSTVAGQSAPQTSYELVVDTARLAAHVDPADRGWLTELTGELHGARLAVAVTLDGGRLATITADLPVPAPRSAAARNKKIPAAAGPSPSLPPTPTSLDAVVSEKFDYRTQAQPVAAP
jgi:hypothetical protein